MTYRERAIQAITHHDTDICPYEVHLTHQAYERLIEYVGDPDYVSKIGGHFVGCAYGNMEEVSPGSGYFRDHFGVVWNRNGADKDIGVVDEYQIPEPSMKGYKLPEVKPEGFRHWLDRLIKENTQNKFFTASIGFSMFERAWTLRGMENLLMDMVAEPDFVDELLDQICEFNLQVIDIALEYPIDGFYLGDDWGQQKGTIMGPSHWRRFIKPRMARMFERIKSAGKYTLLHSCGDIHELFPELIEIGLDVYQTFQPEIYNISEVKREFGKDLSFWGGISTQRVLPWVTPDEVKQITRETIGIMSRGGGYICSPTHSVPGDVPPENIVALVEVFQQQ